MSWFGETFGDSLSSLKGQITKITKEVLAEDDNLNEDQNEAIKVEMKELAALCSSKDLEIMGLREENQKVSQRFQEELKFLRNENRKLKADLSKCKNENILTSDEQSEHVSELSNQLQQLRTERDHLEEIQKDHQSNICLVIEQRDNYKHELEKLKQDYATLELKCNTLLDNQCGESITSNLPSGNLTEDSNNENEIANLRNIVEKLQVQIESYQSEKEETSRVIERHMLNSENLKEKTEKLFEEIKIINSEKENIELENQKLGYEIENLKTEISKKCVDCEIHQKRIIEQEEKIIQLTQIVDNLQSEHSNIMWNLENSASSVLSKLDIEKPENDQLGYYQLLLKSFDLITNKWNNFLEDNINLKVKYKESLSEIQELNNDIQKLRSNIELLNEKYIAAERSYKRDVFSLLNKCVDWKNQEQGGLIKSQNENVRDMVRDMPVSTEVTSNENAELNNEKRSDISERELDTVGSTQDLLLSISSQIEELLNEVSRWKDAAVIKDTEIMRIAEDKEKIHEEYKILENKNEEMLRQNKSLQDKLTENSELRKKMEEDFNSVKKIADRSAMLEKILQHTYQSQMDWDKVYADMQEGKLQINNAIEELKTKLTDNESDLGKMSEENQSLANELIKSTEESNNLKEELDNRKGTMARLELELSELSEQKKMLEHECSQLKSELSRRNDQQEEIQQLRRENNNLINAFNQLQADMQNAVQIRESASAAWNDTESSLRAEIASLKSLCQHHACSLDSLSYENNELKHHIMMVNDKMAELNEENNRLKVEKNSRALAECKTSIDLNGKARNDNKMNVAHQHKRSKSAADCDAACTEIADNGELLSELEKLRELSLRQARDYKTLQEQSAIVSDREAHARKELERLRLHLIEIENDYTEAINEYKTKLNATEEQLKNSSTLYTSTKVRDNQHLESLQGQIRLMTVQRDDLQAKLSAAEDEVQKHKAALTSFHLVLEQFQQDKERELENVATKYENRLSDSERRYAELQEEIKSLNGQLTESKDVLKAASRLGEQLEKKTEKIAELERSLAEVKSRADELEQRYGQVSQANAGKIDKSLMKNLLVGYLSSQQSDRKAQVLRIMAYVLDLDPDERSKIGADGNQSGWLSNLLRPKADGGGHSSSQSLSEAFIRFLENESRPQPQFKLLMERSAVPNQADRPRSSSATPKPSLLLQELVLPTFNSPQTNESMILKDVLKES